MIPPILAHGEQIVLNALGVALVAPLMLIAFGVGAVWYRDKRSSSKMKKVGSVTMLVSGVAFSWIVIWVSNVLFKRRSVGR